MDFRSLMNMYDNWNGITRVNDDELKTVIEDRTVVIMDTREDLFDKEVVAFGFYEGLFYVRLKYIQKEEPKEKTFEEVLAESIEMETKKFTISGIIFQYGTEDDYTLCTEIPLTEDEHNAIMKILENHINEGGSVRGTRREIANEML